MRDRRRRKNKMDKNLGGIAYDAYCKSVGGVSWNGDKLPTWDEMCLDEKKQKLVVAWCASAEAVHAAIEGRVLA